MGFKGIEMFLERQRAYSSGNSFARKMLLTPGYGTIRVMFGGFF